MTFTFETIFLLVVALLAILIILGTAIAVIIVARKPANGKQQVAKPAVTLDEVAQTNEDVVTPQQPTYAPTPIEDIEAYLTEQRDKLADFELQDLSNAFKGTTNQGQRKGVILHLTEPDTPLIAFTSQAYTPSAGTITAETKYGKMELIITQGRAGVQWNGEPLGVLDYTRQRILGPQGQLLGSMERPGDHAGDGGRYPIGFFGQPAAEVITTVNALSTLRWFGNDEIEPLPAFENLNPDLEDDQTLLVMAALLLEIGFFDLL